MHNQTNPVHDVINRATVGMFTAGYKHVVKPCFVFNHDPDTAHDQMIGFCRSVSNMPVMLWMCRNMLAYEDPILNITAGGIQFTNPFGLSAGLDKNCDMPIVLDNAGFGFETVGSTTARPCAGNPKPWFHRLPEYESMMVHVGLANDGSEKVIERIGKTAPKLRSMRISVSIARTNDDMCGDLDEGIEDYATSMLRAVGQTSMIEVNVSCPNTKAGEPFTDDPRNLDRLFAELDPIRHDGQPLLVKMPLNKTWDEMERLLDVLAEHNVQGVTLSNLQKDRTGMNIPGEWEGGLSGGPCYAGSLDLIRRTRERYGDRFLIAGAGGVTTPEQAYAKIKAGAGLIMFISSLMYHGPQQISTLKRGLAELLRRDGYGNVSEAIGADVKK